MPALDPDQEYFKVTEVCGLLRVSKMSVYRLVESGDLDAIRIGRTYRVSRQAVENYLAQASVTVQS
jgi:excisionase family DNA binding protein